jgi:acyl-coenzyme A synthetase/AMP-(fatty) acid ligase
MILDALLHPSFVVKTTEATWDALAIVRTSREYEHHIAALGEPGAVVAVPADDPAATIAWMGAAWATGRVPMPRAGLAAPRLTELPRTEASLVLRTSGSTGTPKYPEFSLGAVRESARRIARYMALSPYDRVAILQPLEHGFTLVGQLLASAVSGATVVAARSAYLDERVERIVEGETTVISAVPFVLRELLDFGLEGVRLRAIGSAGGLLAPALAERLLAMFPDVVLWNQYGCTEAGPRLTACPSTSAAFAYGSVGRAIEGVVLSTTPVSMSEDDGGEIVFATETAMRGYLGDARATEEARFGRGWRTGDLGRIDEDGHVHIDGRTDDIVKVRGLKVSLLAVQAAAERCGAAAALAALVLPPTDESGPIPIGEDGTLCLLYEAPSDISPRALAEHLPIEAMPSRVVRVPSLPRLRNGKVDRRAGRALAADCVKRVA